MKPEWHNHRLWRASTERCRRAGRHANFENKPSSITQPGAENVEPCYEQLSQSASITGRRTCC